MKIVIAMDSFKSSLSASQACDIIAKTISGYLPEAEIIIKPMADGGEGTVRALIDAAEGQWVEQEVIGPLSDMQIEAGFGWFERDKTAVVEMASASGLELLKEKQKNPMVTTTYGTGQLIKVASEYGAEKIFLAVGGSATVDGGVGAAMALGWKFLDKDGNLVCPGGAGLKDIVEIIEPDNFELPDIEVLCDVNNPFCGPEGAARIYGPQKGATEQMVTQLEEGLANLAGLVHKTLNKDIAFLKGAGAAGGLAGGAVAFFDAKIVSGIEKVMEYSKFCGALYSADWVITGEGSFDEQSLHGKVISGVVKAASEKKVKVAVIAGQVKLSEEKYYKFGIEAAIACKDSDITTQYAIKNREVLLKQATVRFTERYLL